MEGRESEMVGEMNNASIDITGQRFGRLTCVSRSGKGDRQREFSWLCKCDCGKEIVTRGSSLRNGSSKSCGCARIESLKNNVTHSLSKDNTGRTTRLYRAWLNMKSRCLNPNTPKFKNHGGRGIAVCDEWINDYVNFHNWAINHGYSDFLTLERKDNDGNYEPSNCTWTTYSRQNLNKRDNHFITHNGETKTLSMWADISGISRSTLHERIFIKGWDIEKALNSPITHPKHWFVEFNGVRKSLKDWARQLGVDYYALRKRFIRGWSTEKALTQPIMETNFRRKKDENKTA